MTDVALIGRDVVAQSKDTSIWNTEPAVARGLVISVVGAGGTILVVFGVLDNEQKEALAENAGTITVAILAIVPIVQAVWTRFGVWSGRTATRIAVENAKAPEGTPPTLSGPP
jgi:hypothetical protein